MKKLTILALHLGYGGIERAITDLSNSLCDKYDIEIVSTYKLYSNPVNELNKKIKVKYLSDLKPNKDELKKSIKKFNIFKIVKEGFKSINILHKKKSLMIKYIKNCDSDIIISTRDIHNNWLGKYGSKKSIKIGWEHNHHHGNMKYASKIIKSCKNLDYFVVVSNNLYNFYKDKIKPKCIFIPNMIDMVEKKSDLNNKNIVSIGRLSQEKGFIDLIDIFNKVHKKNPDWKLNIIGDGQEYNNIKNKIDELKLNDSVILHGFLNKKEIFKILSESSIYAMTSYTESFGIVLLEAFSNGLPCVAFDSAEGANELITNEIDGFLISNRNKEEYINKINLLIEDFKLRKKLGENGIIKANNYSLNIIKEEWINLIETGDKY